MRNLHVYGSIAVENVPAAALCFMRCILPLGIVRHHSIFEHPFRHAVLIPQMDAGDWKHVPLVAAACAFTAARSRLKELSAAPPKPSEVEAHRRALSWRRAGIERWKLRNPSMAASNGFESV